MRTQKASAGVGSKKDQNIDKTSTRCTISWQQIKLQIGIFNLVGTLSTRTKVETDQLF